MNSYKIGSKNKRRTTIKYISIFIFGILFTAMSTQALTIVTGISNAVQYIQEIILTDDGTAIGNVSIVLNGQSGQIGSDQYCDLNLNDCKSIPELVTTGDMNSAIAGYVADNVSDKYTQGVSFNVGSGILNISGAGGQNNLTVNLDGRYRTGSDLIKTNGSTTYYDGSQNFGIGTTSPTTKLQIGNTTQIGYNYTCSLNGGSFIRATGQEPELLGPGCLNTGELETYTPNIQLNYDKRSPSPDLNRKLGGGSKFTIDYSTGTNENPFINRLTINNLGNVGIGTDNPSELLQVAGNVKIDGRLQIGSYSSSNCSPGEIVFTGGNFWGCTSTNTRSQLNN